MDEFCRRQRWHFRRLLVVPVTPTPFLLLLPLPLLRQHPLRHLHPHPLLRPTSAPTSTYTTTVTVAATPTSIPSQCKTGNAQCCKSTSLATNPVTALLLGLLGIVVDGVGGGGGGEFLLPLLVAQSTFSPLEVPPALSSPYFFQVSGSSVFTQYYNNLPVKRDSFTSDGWFITGDLALVDEHGLLHMLGRDKDTINVNGVKHPCVDIEHYIEDSEINGVDNSYVFVGAIRLEGADTETYAVFYQHAGVNPESFRADSGCDEDINGVLNTLWKIKTVCSIFCSQAPHVILPLPPRYFVKTALGKVSRIALTKMYLAAIILKEQEKRTTASQDLSAVEGAVFEGVTTVFELEQSTLSFNQSIFDIGASSMHLIRLKQFLQDRLEIKDIPTIELLKRPVITELCDYLQEIRDRSADKEGTYNPLLCFSPHGSKPPLYLIHPGTGEVLVFINLGRTLDDDRPVYALRARGFEDNEVPHTTMEEIIETYMAAVETNNPSGPYFIAGYSFGGLLAVEIAKRLEKKGKKVQWLGLLNVPPFVQFRINELSWIESLLNLSLFLALVEWKELESFRTRIFHEFPDASIYEEPQSSLQIIEWVFSHCNQSRFAELHMPIKDFHRWVGVSYGLGCTGRDYVPSGVLRGALTTVFCAIPLPSMGNREEFKRLRLSQWKQFSGENFEMVDVDGEHYTMLSENKVNRLPQR
ncbi:hypothetical protein M422DRAFT_248618 [Sphaerobolus stellatus SS14]|nr:hypothetical protein M422DRAFT_248618 [Sphaerobolus stellatus SS14]